MPGVPNITFNLGYGSYEIVKRCNPLSPVSCSDCNGTGKIVLLTSTVKCEKCNIC